MRERPAIRLTPRSFDTVFRSPHALVRVEPGVSGFHKGVVRYFDQTRRNRFGCFVLDATSPAGDFWRDSFRTEAGPLRLASGMPVPGYYLFESTLVVGHVPSGSASIDVPMDDAERILRIAFDGDRLVGASDRMHAVRIVHRVESTLAQRSRRDHTWSSNREPPPRSHTPPPPPPPEPPRLDVYEVLGVPPDADLDTIKRAYKEQMKMNHPDRVAHLSPFLQEMAKQQTVRITAAWETIRRLKGR